MADDCDSEGGVTDSPKKGMKRSLAKCYVGFGGLTAM
jgi:hypothetical protein